MLTSRIQSSSWKTFTWIASIQQMRVVKIHSQVSLILSRSMKGIWIFNHLRGWGETPLSRLLEAAAENKKKRSKLSISHLRMYFDKFSPRSIFRSLEVIKGQFYRNAVLLWKYAIISETIIGKRPRKGTG